MVDTYNDINIIRALNEGIEAATVERLREALRLAIATIEGYQAEIRNGSWIDMIRSDPGLSNKSTLADVGFCQGRVYADALPWIAGVLAGTRRFE